MFDSDEILMGEDVNGEITTAEIKDGKIRGFNTYWLIDKENSYDGNYYLSMSGWCHMVEVDGVEYKSGETLAEDFKPVIDKETLEIIEGYDCYRNEGLFCDECGTFHDSEQYHNVSYIITDGAVLCKTCATMDDLLIEVSDVDDIYKSRDIVGMEIAEGFEEVETIFHDCGWGGPATNHTGAKRIVDELLEKYGTIYAGLTGIGQFQVYVTLYKKVG